MLVLHQHRIYRKDIKANLHALYIFGDNLARSGYGGQAKEMRDEPNSFGIATKRTPAHNYYEDYFYDEQEDVVGIIDEEFKRLHGVLATPHQIGEYYLNYSAVVIPLDGIGTGLSKLPEKAPKLLYYINMKLEALKFL